MVNIYERHIKIIKIYFPAFKLVVKNQLSISDPIIKKQNYAKNCLKIKQCEHTLDIFVNKNSRGIIKFQELNLIITQR